MRRSPVLRAGTKPFIVIVVSLNYVWILRKLLKSKKESHSWRVTFVLAIVTVVVIYGSFKLWEVGGFSP